MARCPTCGARRRGTAPVCHRCRTDLGRVLAVERAADRDRRRALAALERGRGPQARACAERACALHRSTGSLIVRALVALAERDFLTALRLRREIRRAGGGREGPGAPASPPTMHPPA